MALKSTIYKIKLSVADMARNYFAEHALTLARHPSENDERMMVRVLAFALNASEYLAFANGLSTDDEPDLWEKDLTGAIQLWIDVGQPDEKLLKKASGRAEQVLLVTYGRSDVWWQGAKSVLEKIHNLRVLRLPPEVSAALGKLAERNLQVQCTVQEDQVWMSAGEETVAFTLDYLK